MARILFGSEFGANLGHIYPMLRLADQLRGRGQHEIIFAVRSLTQAAAKIHTRGYPVIQGPYWLPPPAPELNGQPTARYTDVLARQGFGFPGILTSMTQGWKDLVDVVKPDLVIADHSPGLSFATRGRVPMVNFGNGFTLPPSNVKTFPFMLQGTKPLMSETDLLGVFNKVAETVQLKRLDYLPQIFDTEKQYVVTVPELDPYARVRGGGWVGPLEDHVDPCPPAANPHIFLYMAHRAKGAEKIVEAVRLSKIPATLFVRDAPENFYQKYDSDLMKMLRQPADFKEVIPASSLVIHSGGGGTATTCLLSGRPQVIAPTHLETSLSCRLLQARGVAQQVNLKMPLEQLVSIVNKMATDKAVQSRSTELAQRLATEDWGRGIEIMVEGIEELL